jgi:tRNA 2-selenouridine synthase
MKYPALLAIEEVLPMLDDFDTIIDVRSPSEFAEDHLPGAINCPVLDDAQRAEIGTLYKQVSPFDAKKRGAALVSKNIGAHIEQHFADKPRRWKPLIYCWRGGNRSGSMTHVLARIGWPAIQLDGGYKEYRRRVVAELETLPLQFDMRVVCGTTGSGKSRLLRTLAAHGAQVLDLEQLAAHRGSVLGNLPTEPQPSQKLFESRIWNALRHFDRARPVYVESESKKVGNVRVPEQLMEHMRASPCIALQLSRGDRVKLLMDEYAHFVADPGHLNAQLERLTQLHGSQTIERWQEMASNAQMPALVGELLERHYDPAYLKSISRNFSQFPRARELQVNEYSEAAWQQAARELLSEVSLSGEMPGRD